jgi:hypothetical protein
MRADDEWEGRRIERVRSVTPAALCLQRSVLAS